MLTPSFTYIDTPLSSPHNHFINIYISAGRQPVFRVGVHAVMCISSLKLLGFISHSGLFRRRSFKHPHTPPLIIIAISNYRRQGRPIGMWQFETLSQHDCWCRLSPNVYRKTFFSYCGREIDFSWSSDRSLGKNQDVAVFIYPSVFEIAGQPNLSGSSCHSTQ